MRIENLHVCKAIGTNPTMPMASVLDLLALYDILLIIERERIDLKRECLYTVVRRCGCINFNSLAVIFFAKTC